MNAQTIPTTFQSEPFYKEQFALFLYQGFTPFLAALKIWPSDNGFSYSISERWKDDTYVVDHIAKLRSDAEAKLRAPTKDELIRELHKRALGMADEDVIKAYRLIAEMIGAIEKPQPTTVNVQQNNTQNRVMIVKDHGTAAEWEEKLRLQQAKLIGSGNG